MEPLFVAGILAGLIGEGLRPVVVGFYRAGRAGGTMMVD